MDGDLAQIIQVEHAPSCERTIDDSWVLDERTVSNSTGVDFQIEIT